MNDLPWYEVWADEGEPFPYLLLVQPKNDEQGTICVYDPLEKNRLVYSAAAYDEVKMWLLEDEYTRVEGRMGLD